MLVNSKLSSAFAERYRGDETIGAFEAASDIAQRPGYFRFGNDAVCYGRAPDKVLRSSPSENLADLLSMVHVRDDRIVLPFDLNEVVDNLRRERYATSSERTQRKVVSTFVGQAYYLLRPFMPVGIRKHLQKLYLKDWRGISFPTWPVDRTVDVILERVMLLLLKLRGRTKTPFIWFWPHGYTGCVTMTHDIETEAGRNFSVRLAEIDASFGFKSAFQIVPEERYKVTYAFLDSLRARDCEVNVHGLNHGPDLFRDEREFLRQAGRINQYAAHYRAAGFRSPGLYRNQDWFGSLRFSYDMSVPASAHLEPQRGGCCTVMPYFIGNILELPLTTTQDYSLFHILGDYSIDLWRREVDLIMRHHGLASFNTHPDYLMSDNSQHVYKELLRYLASLCNENRVWCALPGEIDAWWRQRQQMELAWDGGGFKIVGEGSERAVIAYASTQGDHIAYEMPRSRRTFQAA
jgi:hypothetical protein